MANPLLDPNFCDLLRSFESRGVRYLLVGGYAVILNGYNRTTDDLNVWLAVDPANAERVSLALQDFGFSPEQAPAEGFARAGTMFRFGRAPTKVESLTNPSGVDFEACWADRVIHEVQGLSIPTIGLRHLRQNKAASGRAKDLADLEELPDPP